MNRKVLWLIVAVVFLMLPAIANAQPGRRGGPPPGFGGPPDGGQNPGRPPFGPPGGGPGGPQFDMLLSEIRFGGKVVKGAPYSASIVTENIQVLADGTRISNKGEGKFFRDSEGRTRLERTLTISGPFVISGEAPKMAFIYDPVAGVNYMLEERNRIARKFFAPSGTPPPGQPGRASDQEKTESLGKQIIEGVEAEGVRITVTIPTGQIGNDRPIEIVSERWEATELKVVVLSKHKDPRFGETIYRLTNINRGEQAKSLFEVPAGYSIHEGGPPSERGGPPRGGKRPF
ncbi:MAG: hypothetical protein AAB316_24575 [Bacteroidota bacterium]